MSRPPSGEESWAFCHDILPDVSRSFALIIPRCPPPIDRALCVAYLLCRIADTIEDSAELTTGQRSRLYDTFVDAVETGDERPFLESWPRIPPDDYGRLIAGTAAVLQAYQSLPPELLPPISTCVHDMVGGMRSVQPVETRSGIHFMCGHLPDLDRYCHYVAGTVGIMSTALFESRFAGSSFHATDAWRENGRRLGLALQMTNIIKDCRVDAQRGVSFIPPEFVSLDEEYTLTPARRGALFSHAVAHQDAGMDYVLNVPPDETGIRTFLLGSLLPAIATLEVAATASELHPKIDRSTMSSILSLIERSAADDAAIRAWYETRRRRTLDLARSDAPG